MTPDALALSRSEAASQVATVMAGPGDVVEARLEGRTIFLSFEIDRAEHERRHLASVGAVANRGLLHALWALPEGLPWPINSIVPADIDTLRTEGSGFVAMTSYSLERRGRPPGRVVAIAAASRRLRSALDQVGQYPPIFRRFAYGTRFSRDDPAVAEEARSHGIGAIVATALGLNELAVASAPQVGVPGIYRWWLAEVAYRHWLQTNVH